VVTYFESHDIQLDAIGTFFEHTVTQTADVARALGLIGLDPGAARRSSSNKLLMRIYCRNAGIPTPRFKVIPNLETKGVVAAIKDVGIPCVLKPIFGSESYGTVKIEEGYDIEAILQEITTNTGEGKKEVFKNFSGAFLVEEYLPGPVISVDGIVEDHNVHIVGIVEFIMGPEPRFTQEANYIPARLNSELSEQARVMAKTIIKTLGFDNCGFHCEMRLTPDQGPVLLEIAARLPGGPLQPGHLKASGINLTKELLNVWLGNPLSMKPTADSAVLQKAVFPRKKGVISRIHVPDSLASNKAVWGLTVIVNEGEEVVTYPDIPKPFYYYAINAPSSEELTQLSELVESNIVIEVK
jgi:biotin carboxylase